MRRRYWKSDMSDDELHFFTDGELPVGLSNEITNLIKIIGKHTELRGTAYEELQLKDYSPDNDHAFKYENLGYTEIGAYIRSQRNSDQMYISRRDLINLSRKWRMSRVSIHFDALDIIKAIFQYVEDEPLLKSKCANYFDDNKDWDMFMPIQYDFLRTRIRDDRKNAIEARKLVHDLNEYLEDFREK